MKQGGNNSCSNEEENRSRCWSTIGVWGQERPRCQELSKVYHCNNCEIFKEAAHDSLSRLSPMGYLEEQTERYKENVLPTKLISVSAVIFRLLDQWYGLATNSAGEVIAPRPIRKIPHFDSSIVLGLVNVKGRLCLSISLQQLLGIYLCEVEDRGAGRFSDRRMLVMNGNEGCTYIFSVDQVAGVERLIKNTTDNKDIKYDSDLIGDKIKWRNKAVWLLDEKKLVESIVRVIG